jgi:hypothetical protein
MNTYFVECENYKDMANILNVLGLMIEYAKFLEEEIGRTNNSHVDTILHDNNVRYRMEETSIK